MTCQVRVLFEHARAAAMEPTGERPDDRMRPRRGVGVAATAMGAASDWPEDRPWLRVALEKRRAAMEPAGDGRMTGHKTCEHAGWVMLQWSRPLDGRLTQRHHVGGGSVQSPQWSRPTIGRMTKSPGT